MLQTNENLKRLTRLVAEAHEHTSSQKMLEEARYFLYEMGLAVYLPHDHPLRENLYQPKGPPDDRC